MLGVGLEERLVVALESLQALRRLGVALQTLGLGIGLEVLRGVRLEYAWWGVGLEALVRRLGIGYERRGVNLVWGVLCVSVSGLEVVVHEP